MFYDNSHIYFQIQQLNCVVWELFYLMQFQLFFTNEHIYKLLLLCIETLIS